ncbi:MAG: methyltransferase domain-containing protein [Ruminococcus sp.]|nr:methyltransferase domain-containing protein [Ruminococcus sp.]
MSELSVWMCPVCGELLTDSGNSLKCSKNHCFDKARSGYVNLLPVSRKHAKLPGDNPEMVRARRNFLEKNYYQHLQNALCDAVKNYLPADGILLDAGCGEGYYTKKISSSLPDGAFCCGVDISKIAVDFSARQDKRTQYAVGSVFHLPVVDSSCNMLVSVFAPYAGTEFVRVLKSKSYLIMAIPSAFHLWELKQAVYDKPYENQVKDYHLDDFRFLEKINCEKRIFLDSPEDIQNLFQMTPYAYRTGAPERERLQALQSFEVQTAFEILIYQKEA